MSVLPFEAVDYSALRMYVVMPPEAARRIQSLKRSRNFGSYVYSESWVAQTLCPSQVWRPNFEHATGHGNVTDLAVSFTQKNILI